ncbi:MAG: alpha/beta fold hydrolase [Rickettsiales bacterium]
MYKKIDDSHIYYEIINKDKPETIIFIHGLGSDNSCFRAYLQYFTNYRIIVFDLPAFGKSNNNKAYNLAEEIRLTTKFIKSFKLTNYHIVAYSLGGIIAMQHIAQHQNMVKKLILINTPLSLVRVSYLTRLMLILRYYFSFILPFKLLAKIICNNLFSANEALAKLFYKQIINSDRKTYKNIVKNLKYYDIANYQHKLFNTEFLAQINRKILYIFGTEDKLIDSQSQLKLSQAKNYKLINGNHGLFEEQQVKEIGQEILKFIAEL